MPSTLLAATILASYIASETVSLGVERLIIKDPNLPKPWHNLRVCFLSDIHHGRYSSVKRLEKMVRKINNLNADMILLGGDYLQTFRRSDAKKRRDFQELMEVFKGLNYPPLGIFAVLGNHDSHLPENFFREEFAKVGIRLFENEGVVLEKEKARLFVGGVEDLWYGKPSWKLASTLAKPDDFKLLLAHQPNYIDELKPADRVNFVFAGHTHGAQISMFYYMPLFPPKVTKWEYRVGLIETKQTRMLVSPGVGTVPPYFRFGAPPKIHLLTFKSAPRVSVFK